MAPVVRSLFEGDSASFTCTVTGFPPPEITWSLHTSGNQVNGSSHEILSLTADSSQLIIKNITHADRGYYECRATSLRMQPANARCFLGVKKG